MTAAEQVRAGIAAALPPGCALAVVAIDGSQPVCALDRPPPRASALRLREFAAGRDAARRALAMLDVDAPALPAADDRAPCWPAGIAGSIAHGGGLALAVVAAQPQVALLGIDLEPWRELEDDLVELIVTGGERARGLTCAPLAAFCAKEAVFKAAWPRLRRFLEFADVELAPADRDGADGWRRYRVVGGPAGPLALAIAAARCGDYQWALAWSAGGQGRRQAVAEQPAGRGHGWPSGGARAHALHPP